MRSLLARRSRALITAWALGVALAASVLVAACTSPAGAPDVATPVPVSSTTAPQASPELSPSPMSSPAAAPSLRIDAVGDISLARGVVDRMKANGAAYPFALVASMLDGDINVGNLEGPLTDRGEPWPKGYNFRTPPEYASSLTAGHIGVVTLANNHAMDYGVTGLIDTIAALRSAGIEYSGLLADAAAHPSPTIMTVNGLRVAMLGFVTTPDEAGGFTISQWAPGADTPGVAIGTPSVVADAVTAARGVADFVIVLEHAGDEYHVAANATQRAIADAALAAGADAYIGAHAHVPQAIEMRGHQLVAYGLGNFVFALDQADLANIPEPRVAPILKLTLTKGVGVSSYEVSAVTLDANEHRPRPATADEAAALRTMMGG